MSNKCKFLIAIISSAILLSGCISVKPNTGYVSTTFTGDMPTTYEYVFEDDVPYVSSAYDNYNDIPDYSGKAYAVINGNVPFFTKDELTETSFESYSDMDFLGRCGAAYACVGVDIMPTEERGAIGQVKPTGWHTSKYDFVDGKYLYNRCHLLGYQLTGENANVKNLITGTRYLNVVGMLPFENDIADYVRSTYNHVLYRVTPIFTNNNLLADGVLMEALSIEDGGVGICFNVFCYNVQPGVTIDYATGENWDSNAPPETIAVNSGCKYVLNVNSKKFHRPDCENAAQIKHTNKREVDTPYDELISQGYSPCGHCNPD